jgi:hypothetical protein
MKDAVPSMFSFDVSGFQVEWSYDHIIYFPYNSAYYVEFKNTESEYAVMVAFGFSPMFHDIIKVVCADRNEAELFYSLMKKKI